MIDILNYWHTHFFSFLTFIGIVGACIGSFLNVVIHRLPIILENEWQLQCSELLNLPSRSHVKTLSLFTPRSHCPHCKQTISIFANIPIISYLMLRGQCAHCHHKISLRYFVIEVCCLVLSLQVAWFFGVSLLTLAALLFTWTLLCLTAIDFEHQLLPDQLTLLLLWAGLFFSLFNIFVKPEDAIIGALSGYLSLWLIGHVFTLITGKEGMGYGDFKLFAAFGAWLGWHILPFILLFSSLCGALVGITLIVIKKAGRNTPLAFGPYLAVSGWLAMMYGQDILHFYLLWSQ